MIDNVYELVTRTMEQEFPQNVAFRFVDDATGTVVEKTYGAYARDIRRAAAWFEQNVPDIRGKRVALLCRNLKLMNNLVIDVRPLHIAINAKRNLKQAQIVVCCCHFNILL